MIDKNDDWFDIKLLIDCNKWRDNKQCIKDDTYQDATEVVSKKFNIFSTNFVHFGRGIGPIETEVKKMEPQYIKNIGNCKLDTQYECYSDNMPIKITKVMTGASENHKFH